MRSSSSQPSRPLPGFCRIGRTLALAAVAMLSVAPVPADGIVIRHDRDDALYRELGAKYPAACLIMPEAFAGVLVAPQWVLTAAHGAVVITPFGMHVRFGDDHYAIDKIIIHPDFVRGDIGRDLALLKLDRPVEGISPVLLYDREDEAGQVVTFIGWGDTGDGRTGPKTMDGIKRGAHNRVEAANGTSIRFKFDAPPAGEHLEGISGPGDSGGPALVERDGLLYTLGVSSSNSGDDEDHCTYGTIETYARVSTARDWINDSISEDAAATISWSDPVEIDADRLATLPGGGGAGSGVFPDTDAGRVAGEYLAAFNSLDPQMRWRFEQKHYPMRILERIDATEREAQLRPAIEKYGRLSLLAYSEAGPKLIAVRLRARKTGDEVAFMIRFDPNEPGKILRVSFGPLPATP